MVKIGCSYKNTRMMINELVRIFFRWSNLMTYFKYHISVNFSLMEDGLVGNYEKH